MVKELNMAQKISIHAAWVVVLLSMVTVQRSAAATPPLTPVSSAASVALIETSAWEMPEDFEAKTYLASCETGFMRVIAELESFAHVNLPKDLALLDKLNKMDFILDLQLSRAGLYSNVHPNKAVRSAAEVCEQRFVEVSTDISLSRPIYDQLKRVDITNLSQSDKRYLEHLLRNYRRSGVDKDQATRDKIKKLSEEINLIGQQFEKNYREGGKKIELGSVQELKGLPADYIERHKPNADGKIIITTDTTDYMPIMQYAKSDALRERLYRAYRDMAYPDNKIVLENLMAKRYEFAQILGYADYAAYVTGDKMIKSAKNAQEFIDKVSVLATPLAQQEYQVLLKRLKKINAKAVRVDDWQKMYLQELIKKEKYHVDSQKIRQYFPFAKVQQGVFDLTQTMFGVSIRPWQTETWHPSVKAFEVVDGNQVIGRFFLDMHPREGKYKHAAQFGVQSGVKGVQLPVAALVCNFPGGENPNELMEHSDVETYLHEFGHLLHTLFSGEHERVAFSGTKTEWDFVEAPSQMLEEWVWDAETLTSFARNDKGEVIPEDLVSKMSAGRDFGRGLWTKHQLFYAATSLNVYNKNPAGVDLDKLTAKIQATYSPFGYVDGTHFYTSFGHLNGYSAIYYTYMWSLVIANDMFSEFEKQGLRNPEVAQRYRRTVLAPGGSKDAADLVQDFLGRPFSFDAFAKNLKELR